MPSSLDELDVKVYIDYPQYRRNIKAPFVYAADGTSWDSSTLVNAYIEPVTRTVMGMPVPMTPEWKTTFTGQGYTRFQKTDFTFTSPSSWGNIFFYGTNDCYLFCASNVSGILNAPVSLNGGVTRNQPLFFSFIKQNKKESNTNITAKLFWAGNSFNDKDTQLHFKDDGSCDIYRGYIILDGTILCTTSSAVVTGTGTFFTTDIPGSSVLYTEDGRTIGTVSTITNNTTLTLTAAPSFNYAGNFHIKQPKKVASYSRNENNYNQQAVGISNNNPNNDYNDVYIIPMRGKELVVNTTFGLNFSHTFDDLIDPNDVPTTFGPYFGVNTGQTTTTSQTFLLQEVLPTGAFSIVIPNGKVAFQLAKLYFLSNWSVKSNLIQNEVSQQGYNNTSYRTVSPEVGTIAASTYSNIITGTGTGFLASWVGGRLFGINADSTQAYEIGTVFSVASTTSLTLTASSQVFASAATFTIMKKKTGTITSTTSSNIITGVGTLFTTEVALNDDVYDPDNNYLGKVQSISSNTSMTLYYNSMTDCSGSAYWLNYPIIKEIFQNNNAELIGPANSSMYSDISLPVMEFLVNGNDTTALTEGTSVVIYVYSKSTSDPTNPLKNNDSTHCLYSADIIIYFANQRTKTTINDITSAIENLSIEKSEDGENACSFTARKQNLVDLGMTYPERITNRPVKITLKPRDLAYDEITIFQGYLKNPDIEYINGVNFDKYSLLTFEGYDKKQLLNDVYFTKAPSYDGISLFNAMQELFYYGGALDSLTGYEYPYSFLGYYFGINRNNSNGQYNWTANISDSVGSFIEKMRSDIAQNITFRYTNEWRFISTLNRYYNVDVLAFSDRNINALGASTFSLPLYLSETSAITYGSIPQTKTYKRTIRNLKRTFEQPEANQVIVIGTDKTNNNRITAIIDDVSSQNPFITLRPNNWLGMVKSFCIQNDRFTSQNVVAKAAQSFFDKISTGREIVEFTSDYLTYFDNTSKQPNAEPLPPKTGTIDTFTYSNGVGGTGTLFLSQLSIGDTLYSPDGYVIGVVQSITSNTALTLTTNALVAVSSSQYYTRNPWKWLNQYDFLDCDQDVEIFENNGTSAGKYRVISYKVDFVKGNIPGYISGIVVNPDQINIAQATYKAVKINYTNKMPIVEKDAVNAFFENNINVLKNTASKSVLSFYTGGSGLSYSTSGAPAGMSFSLSTYSDYQQDLIINWTPTPAQSKQSYTFFVSITNAFGSGNTISIPLTFKVFDTL